MHAVGTIIDRRYRLTDLLGSGAMGRVWRAEHLGLARPVAVKLIAPELVGRAEALARFRREARAQARLVHPHVVGTLDFGDHDGQPFLVLEYVPGRTLEELVAADGPLELVRALELAIQIADGLGAAHAAGIVHRDVKPGNVLVAGAPGHEVAKVGDFGLATLRDDAGARLTQAGLAIGTPAYLAPEQFVGQPVDARADVYGLGCLVHELLTGEPPFGDGSPVALLHAHLHSAPPRPREARPTLPAALDDLVVAMLAKESAARPHDAREVARRLRAVQAALTTEAPAAGVVVAILGVTTAGAAAAIAAIAGAAGGDLTTEGGAHVARFAHPEAALRAAASVRQLAGKRLRVAVHAGTPDDPVTLATALRLAALAGDGEGVVSAPVHAAIGLGGRARLAPRGTFASPGGAFAVYRLRDPGETSRPRAVEAAGARVGDDVVFTCECGAAGRIAAAPRASRYDATCPSCGAACRISAPLADATAAPAPARALTIGEAIALPSRDRDDDDHAVLAQLAGLD